MSQSLHRVFCASMLRHVYLVALDVYSAVQMYMECLALYRRDRAGHSHHTERTVSFGNFRQNAALALHEPSLCECYMNRKPSVIYWPSESDLAFLDDLKIEMLGN